MLEYGVDGICFNVVNVDCICFGLLDEKMIESWVVVWGLLVKDYMGGNLLI